MRDRPGGRRSPPHHPPRAGAGWEEQGPRVARRERVEGRLQKAAESSFTLMEAPANLASCLMCAPFFPMMAPTAWVGMKRFTISCSGYCRGERRQKTFQGLLRTHFELCARAAPGRGQSGAGCTAAWGSAGGKLEEGSRTQASVTGQSKRKQTPLAPLGVCWTQNVVHSQVFCHTHSVSFTCLHPRNQLSTRAERRARSRLVGGSGKLPVRPAARSRPFTRVAPYSRQGSHYTCLVTAQRHTGEATGACAVGVRR